MADTNASGMASLDAMIARVSAVPDMVQSAAPEVATAVELELERTIRAGTTADGRGWAPKKQGTGTPLAGAEKSLRVVAIGKTVFATLRGHIARHHLGRAKGGTVREILPTSRALPPSMDLAVRRVLERRFRAVMGT
jgi:hypothetical protein